MDRESVERLRFDRRLQRRRDWVETGKFDEHADSLPDVSEKMTTAAELEAEETAAAEAAPVNVPEPVAAPSPPVFGSFGAAEPATQEPVPIAGDFGAPTSLGGGSFGNDSNGGNSGSNSGSNSGDTSGGNSGETSGGNQGGNVS